MLALALVLAAGPGWEAPPGCPGADALERRVVELTGRLPADAELHVDAVVEGPPWRVTIELGSEGVRERRVVQGQGCEGLVEVVAVVVAVAMDPVEVAQRRGVGRAAATATSTATRTATDPDPGPAPVRAPAEDPQAPPRRRAANELGARIGGGVSIGGWDQAAGGVEAAFVWARGVLAIDVVGRYWIRRRDELEDQGAVEVELGTVGVLACGRGRFGRWTLLGCGGIEAGDYVVRGVAAPALETAHFPWVAPLVAGRVGVQLRGPVSLWLGLEAAVPVIRAQAQLRAMEPVTVYDAGSPVVRAIGGIELRWGLRGRSRVP